MGFRLHRSIKLFPGLRLNFSKSGIGFSAGVKGYHVSRMANGRTRRTISIPGTGMSWVTEKSRHTRASSDPSSVPVPTPIVTPAEPGWHAPQAERDLHEALMAHDTTRMLVLGEGSSPIAHAANTLAALTLLQADRDDEARRLLHQVFDAGFDPAGDPFIERYTQIAVSVEVVDGASSSLPLDRTTIGLLLAELEQRNSDAEGAITIVESLEPSTTTALSLAELYVEVARFDDVIEITDNAPNNDDATSLLWVFRGFAFREKHQYDAARECLSRVIRCKSRNPIVLHRARFERARCYAAEGKTAQARKDLVNIRAEDADYDGLDAAIAELDHPGGP